MSFMYVCLNFRNQVESLLESISVTFVNLVTTTKKSPGIKIYRHVNGVGKNILIIRTEVLVFSVVWTDLGNYPLLT